jgi:hypothetical protein
MSDSPAASAFPSVSYETWRSRVAAELAGDAEARLRREALEGLTVEPLYAADRADDGVSVPCVAPLAGDGRIRQLLPS